MATGFDDLIAKYSGGDNGFSDLIAKYNPKPKLGLDTSAPLGSEGFLGGVAEFGRGVARGVTSGLPEQVGKAAEFFGAEDTGRALQAYAKETAAAHPELKESVIGQAAREQNVLSPRGAAGSAGENTPLSVGPGLAGAGIGGAIGSAVAPGPGTLAGAGIGYVVGSLAALPIFYGSQAQESKEAIKAGLLKSGMGEAEAEAQANRGGHIAGTIEAGLEGAADLIPGYKLAKPFLKPVTGSLVRSTLGRSIGKAAKDVAQIEAGEISTEMIQQAGEKQVEHAFGAEHEGATWKDTASVIMPTAIMSLFPGGLTVAHNFHSIGKVRDALETKPPVDLDPQQLLQDKERRGAAVSVVFHQIAQRNEPVAKAFDDYAADQIALKEPIKIEDDQFYLDYLKDNPTRVVPPTPSQVAGIDPSVGPLSSAAATAVDTGLTAAVTGVKQDAIGQVEQAKQVETAKATEGLTDEQINQKLAEAQAPPPPAMTTTPKEALASIIAKRAETGKAAGETTQSQVKLVPYPKVEAARAAADALEKRTGDAYQVVPHPTRHDQFTAIPTGEKAAVAKPAAETPTVTKTVTSVPGEGSTTKITTTAGNVTKEVTKRGGHVVKTVTKEDQSAGQVRSDQGQVGVAGQAVVASENIGGKNLQQPAQARAGASDGMVVGGPVAGVQQAEVKVAPTNLVASEESNATKETAPVVGASANVESHPANVEGSGAREAGVAQQEPTKAEVASEAAPTAIGAAAQQPAPKGAETPAAAAQTSEGVASLTPEQIAESRKIGVPDKSTATHPMRPLVEGLIKRRAVAIHDIGDAIDRAREMMQGKRELTKVEAAFFKREAQRASAQDRPTSAALSAIADHIAEHLPPPGPRVQTEKQKAAIAARKRIDTDKDTLNAAITKLGGVHKKYQEDITGEAGGYNPGVPGVGTLFRENGHGLDTLAQALSEPPYSYLTQKDLEEVDGGVGKLKEMIRDEIAGSPHHSLFRDFTPKELQESGHDDLNPQEAEAIQAAYDEADRLAAEQSQEEGVVLSDEDIDKYFDGWAGETKSIAPREQAKGEVSAEKPAAPASEKVTPKKAAKKAPKKQEPKFDLGAGSNGMPRTAVEFALIGLKVGWNNAPNIHVVDTPAEFPLKSPATARGTFYQGEVWLAASNITDARDAQFTVLHEVVGHYGLAGVFGEQLTPMLERIYASNADIRAEADARIAHYAKNDVALNTAIATEEALADRAAKQGLEGVSGWKLLVAAMRAALRKLGFNLQFTEADIAGILATSKRFVEAGGKSEREFDQPLFSLKTDGIVGAAQQYFYDSVSSAKQFNWMHRRISTQFHKAQINPQFRPVFQAAQRYIQDVSAFSHESADKAGEDILPRLGKLSDAFKNIFKVKQIDRDLGAAAKATWAATLAEVKLTNAQLKAGVTVKAKDDAGVIGDITIPPLTDKQIEYYNRVRASIDLSLDHVAVSEMAKLMHGEGLADIVQQAKEDSANGFKIISDAIRIQAAALRAADNEKEALRKEAFLELTKDHTGTRTLADLNANAQRLKDQSYAPLMRFGRHTLRVSEVGDGSTVTTLFYGMFDNAREMNRTAREMKELYPNAVVQPGTLDAESWKMFRGLSLDSMVAFSQAVGLDQYPMVQEFLRTAVSSRSAMKRLIHRKGIQGYDEDVRRVLASFITSQGRLAAGNYHFGEMTRAHADIPQDMGDVREEAAKLIMYVQNPNEEAQALRSILFVNFIGGSIASALTNMTQPIMMTLPYLSQFNGPLAASGALKAGLSVAGGGVAKDPILRYAMDRAAKEGITEPQELHQLFAESIRGFGSNLWTRKGMRVWGSMFAVAESFNRRITFAAAFELARKEGGLAKINEMQVKRDLQTFADPFEFATYAVEETQGIYNKGNRPNWARGAIGATLFTFKQFTIAYLEFLSRLPAREKLLAGSLLLLAAGLQGAPGADDLENLIDTIGQLMGYSTNSRKFLREQAVAAIGETAGGLLTHGISGVPGVPLDVQGRLGIHQLIPLSGAFKRSEVDKSRQIADAVGPIGGLYQQAQRGFESLEAGNPAEALQQGTPRALQDFLKGMDMLQTGQYRTHRGEKVLDTTAADAILKSIGLQPQDVAMEQRTQRDIRQDIDLHNTVESAIANRWAQGIVNQDPDSVRSAVEEMLAWNLRNQDSPVLINQQQIRQRVQASLIDRSVRTIKQAPKEIRGNVLDSLR